MQKVTRLWNYDSRFYLEISYPRLGRIGRRFTWIIYQVANVRIRFKAHCQPCQDCVTAIKTELVSYFDGDLSVIKKDGWILEVEITCEDAGKFIDSDDFYVMTGIIGHWASCCSQNVHYDPNIAV